jgi:ankyrin repeat protein
MAVETPPSTPRARPRTEPPRLVHSSVKRLHKELDAAVDNGSFEDAYELLSPDGRSPLHKAVKASNVKAVKVLLERLDPNMTRPEEGSLLQVCAEMIFESESRSPKLANFASSRDRVPFGVLTLDQLQLPNPPQLDAPSLLDKGNACPVLFPSFEPEDSRDNRTGFWSSSQDQNSLFPFGLVLAPKAKMLEITRLLLDAGATPDGKVLLKAAQCADPELGLQLLEFGADANSTLDDDCATPLWHAAQKCPALIMPLLRAGADPFLSCRGLLPVDVATAEGRRILAREMLWLRCRLFVWARSRGVSESISLANVPDSCCRLVMDFL